MCKRFKGLLILHHQTFHGAAPSTHPCRSLHTSEHSGTAPTVGNLFPYIQLNLKQCIRYIVNVNTARSCNRPQGPMCKCSNLLSNLSHSLNLIHGVAKAGPTYSRWLLGEFSWFDRSDIDLVISAAAIFVEASPLRHAAMTSRTTCILSWYKCLLVSVFAAANLLWQRLSIKASIASGLQNAPGSGRSLSSWTNGIPERSVPPMAIGNSELEDAAKFEGGWVACASAIAAPMCDIVIHRDDVLLFSWWVCSFINGSRRWLKFWCCVVSQKLFQGHHCPQGFLWPCCKSQEQPWETSCEVHSVSLLRCLQGLCVYWCFKITNRHCPPHFATKVYGSLGAWVFQLLPAAKCSWHHCYLCKCKSTFSSQSSMSANVQAKSHLKLHCSTRTPQPPQTTD